MESAHKRNDGHSVAVVKSLISCQTLAASGVGASKWAKGLTNSHWSSLSESRDFSATLLIVAVVAEQFSKIPKSLCSLS